MTQKEILSGSFNCTHFNYCNAPICPEDQSSMDNAIFYSDEEICCRYEYSKLPQIRMMRKLKKIKSQGYFDWEMLGRNCKVSKGMKGLDPDKTDEPQRGKWFESHPEKRKLSEEEKEKLREHAKKYFKH